MRQPARSHVSTEPRVSIDVNIPRYPAFVPLAGMVAAVIMSAGCSGTSGTSGGFATRADQGTFVTTLGRDTVVIESFTRSATKLDGDVVVRIPGTVLIHYTVDLAGDGSPVRSVASVEPLGTDLVQSREVTITYRRDTTVIESAAAGRSTIKRVARRDRPYPQLVTGFGPAVGLYGSPALYELYTPVIFARSGGTIPLTTVDVVSGNVRRRVFRQPSSRELDVDFFGIGWTRFTLDDDRRIIAADAGGTTEQVQTTRTDFMDARVAAEQFAASDKAGRGLGAVSPRQVFDGAISGKPIVIHFSSPRTRGRAVLGDVVPYDTVWRTGANEATTLTIGAAMDIGGTRLAAGRYSLWTLPMRDGRATLIINSQAGQWGTEYDASRDLARIPMATAVSASPREAFTISVTDATGTAPAQLVMSWDRFEWRVPIRLAD